MSQIAAAEGGRVFFDQDNKLVFWNRNHISLASEPVEILKFGDYIMDQPYEISDKDIKNIIKVQAESRQVYEEQAIWDVSDEYKDEFKRVYAYADDEDNDLQFEVSLENPVTEFTRPLEAGVDFTANSVADGSGTDLTSLIEIVELRTYIKSIVFRIRYNAASGIAYLTKLQVRGTPAKVYNRIKVEVYDDFSIGLFGDKVKTIENPYIDNYDYAVSLAQIQLNMFANTLSNFFTEIIALPWLQPGDIVGVQTIPEDATSIVNYLITKVRWNWQPRAGATMTLNLAINYTDYNKFEDTLVFASESHTFTIGSTTFHWDSAEGGIVNDLDWNMGEWS
jgi:hypothetical protein